MQFSAEGAKETLQEQMKFRFKEAEAKLGQAKALMEVPKMSKLGFLAGTRTIFDSVIRSTVLYSASCWVGMTRAQYEWCDRKDKDLLFTMLKINSKTKYYSVCWELSLLPLEFLIMREKISLVSHLLHGKVSAAARMAMEEVRVEWRPGLVAEVRKWCGANGLPDPAVTPLSAEAIGMAVERAGRAKMFASLATDKYAKRNMIKEEWPEYIYQDTDVMSNLEQKLIFSWRLGILQFKTRYRSMFSNDSCIYRGCPGSDSLTHSLWSCEYNPVPRPRDPESVSEMKKYLAGLQSERTRHGIPLVYM